MRFQTAIKAMVNLTLVSTSIYASINLVNSYWISFLPETHLINLLICYIFGLTVLMISFPTKSTPIQAEDWDIMADNRLSFYIPLSILNIALVLLVVWVADKI